MEYRYSPFEPRVWVILEVAYYLTLTHRGGSVIPRDIETFFFHISVLTKEESAGIYLLALLFRMAAKDLKSLHD
jgi:hypothetical protein